MGADGRVTPVMKVKLSIQGDAPERGVQQVPIYLPTHPPTDLHAYRPTYPTYLRIIQVVWAGPGLLATACGETLVRLWDVGREEN